jgi:hypothetical protein
MGDEKRLPASPSFGQGLATFFIALAPGLFIDVIRDIV